MIIYDFHKNSEIYDVLSIVFHLFIQPSPALVSHLFHFAFCLFSPIFFHDRAMFYDSSDAVKNQFV